MFDSPMGCNLLVTQASGKPMTFCACSRLARELKGKSTRDKGINNSRSRREKAKLEERKQPSPVTYRIPTEVSARKEYTDTLKGVILAVAIKRVARNVSQCQIGLNAVVQKPKQKHGIP